MRTLNEVMDTSPEKSPFSNGTEGYDWMYRWCDRCCHPVEVAWQNYSNGKRKTQLKGYEGGCPLLMAALAGHTPAEWLEQDEGPDRYHCVEFRGGDGDGEEPRPRPNPPGMDGLFLRPERSVRMLKQSEPDYAEAAVGVGEQPRGKQHREVARRRALWGIGEQPQ